MEEKTGVLEKTTEVTADIGANEEQNDHDVTVKKSHVKAVKPVDEEKLQELVLDLRQFAFSRGLTSVKMAGFEAWLLNNILGVRHTAAEFDVLLKEFER